MGLSMKCYDALALVLLVVVALLLLCHIPYTPTTATPPSPEGAHQQSTTNSGERGKKQ